MLICQLSTTLQALAVLQHLYAPSFWVLFGRLLAQLRKCYCRVQITDCPEIRAPPILSPNRSLLGLFLLVTLTNGLAVLFHWGAGPPDGQRGVPIDFVGQSEYIITARWQLTLRKSSVNDPYHPARHCHLRIAVDHVDRMLRG